MDKNFQLDIITPTSLLSINNVSYLRIPGLDGLLGVQAKHAKSIIALNIGEIKIMNAQGKTSYYATNGGFVDIKPEGIQLLLETFESSADLNKKRAEDSLKRAKQRMSDKTQDLKRANESLKRAQNRLHIISRVSS